MSYIVQWAIPEVIYFSIWFRSQRQIYVSKKLSDVQSFFFYHLFLFFYRLEASRRWTGKTNIHLLLWFQLPQKWPDVLLALFTFRKRFFVPQNFFYILGDNWLRQVCKYLSPGMKRMKLGSVAQFQLLLSVGVYKLVFFIFTKILIQSLCYFTCTITIWTIFARNGLLIFLLVSM